MDDLIKLVSDIADLLDRYFSIDGIYQLITDIIFTVLDFAYELLFIDLFGTCRIYGSKLLNFLYGSFCKSPFTMDSLVFVVGFIFIIFAIKMTLKIVRG